VSLKTKILALFMVFGGLSAYGQTFMYSYIDPCTQQIQTLMYDMSAPIIVSYYGQTRAFTYNEISSGVLDTWLNQVYSNYVSSPCDQVLTSVTTTSTTNITTNVVNTVLNLGTITNISSININVGGNVNTGNQSNSNSSNEGNNNNNQGNSSNSNSTSSNSNNNSSSSSSGSSTSGSGSNSGSNNGSSSNGSNSGGGNSGSNGSGSNGSGEGGNGGNSGGGTNGGSEKGGTGTGTNEGGVQGDSKEGSTPSQEEITEVKEDQQQTSSQQTSKSTSKAKAQVQKPAILVTGDIVGLQRTEDKSQDARATMSFTRVKGDGTASLGLSADYMVNARIGNITLMKSWIGVKENGNKHINLVSSGFSFQPGAWSNTTMFIRVNSLKKATFIFGAAGSAGMLYEEPIISTLAIGGFMYKGKLYKNIDATIIAAGVYSPYTKYYTESWFDSKPIIVPFFNLNYKMTKTFGVGLTGGGTYLAGQDVLNYQVLLGAKLIL